MQTHARPGGSAKWGPWISVKAVNQQQSHMRHRELLASCLLGGLGPVNLSERRETLGTQELEENKSTSQTSVSITLTCSLTTVCKTCVGELNGKHLFFCCGGMLSSKQDLFHETQSSVFFLVLIHLLRHTPLLRTAYSFITLLSCGVALLWYRTRFREEIGF